MVYRSTGSSTSTTVIWFIVSVPVLSELIADVDPSVSTDTSSLTIAFSPASSFAPAERITCRTVGSAVGIAAMASAIAVMNSASADCPRDRPSANITIIVTSAAAPIHRVNVFSCLVSGVCCLAVVASMPAIFPTWASAPTAVTSITPLPWVTGVFMNAMFVWSPGPRSASASGVVSFDAGVLSPGQRGLVDVQRAGPDDPAVGGHVVAGGQQHQVADRRPARPGSSASAPSRRTRAVRFVNDFSAFIALSALPS